VSSADFGDSSDATAKRDSLGVYVVTFDRDAIDGASSAPRNARWLDDCAVVATPRTGGYFDGAAQDTTLTVMHTATSAVVVIATRPDYQLRRSVLQDTAFEIAAIC
jgi:hypothetical protein